MSQIPTGQPTPNDPFPGHAETLATPVGSEVPVRVRPRQSPNKHLRLSKAEFRRRSAEQREIDAQMDAGEEPTTSENPLPMSNHVVPLEEPGPGAPPPMTSGPPSPAPLPTKAPAPTDPALSNHALEQRILRIERGMDAIVCALAERDARTEHAAEIGHTAPECGYTSPMNTCASGGNEGEIIDAEYEVVEPTEDEVEEPAPGESTDKPPLRVVGVEDGDWDRGMQELQQMIARRNPLKQFRQHWCGLTRSGQYNEWMPARQETFTELFNSMVVHPKFLYQIAAFLRGSRSGNCVGNEQIARVAPIVAGCLTVYQLAAAGK